MVTEEVASITVLVNYFDESSIIPFKIYRQEEYLIAVPWTGKEEKKKLGLPENIFIPISGPHPRVEGHDIATLKVVNDIFRELRILHLV